MLQPIAIGTFICHWRMSNTVVLLGRRSFFRKRFQILVAITIVVVSTAAAVAATADSYARFVVA